LRHFGVERNFRSCRLFQLSIAASTQGHLTPESLYQELLTEIDGGKRSIANHILDIA
jgi:hypothetical protein